MILKKILKLARPVVEKFPKAAAAYRLIRDNDLNPEAKKTTPMGFKLVGNPLMEKGLFEIDEGSIIEDYLKKADVFVNIGANIGYYCCFALKHNKKTVAFEPIDTNLRYLYANVKANGWEQDIEIFPVALGNYQGLIEIYGSGTGASVIPGWAGTPQNYKKVVPIFTLDNVLNNRFSGQKIFFLVDVEGAEKFMLEGAENYLKMSPKPDWLVEISVTEHQPAGIVINPNLLETFEFFWRNGYEARTANSESRIIKKEEIVNIIKTGENTLEIHNFLFISAN